MQVIDWAAQGGALEREEWISRRVAGRRPPVMPNGTACSWPKSWGRSVRIMCGVFSGATASRWNATVGGRSARMPLLFRSRLMSSAFILAPRR